MTIIHFLLGRVVPDSSNGVEKAVYFLSRAQSEQGQRVCIFSLSHKKTIPIEGVEVRTFSPHRNPLSLPSGLCSAINEISPDVVHLHSVFVPQFIILAKLLRSEAIPYAITPHGGLAPQALRKKRCKKKAFRWLLERSYWNNAAFVHALVELEADYFRLYGIKRPIVIAPNAIDPSEIPNPESLNTSYLQELYPQVSGKRVFLFLGRLDPSHKGLDLLLNAFAQAKRAVENAVLIFVGPDWHGQRASLEQLACKLQLQDRVIFTGPKYGIEKFEMMASADIFVHTSRWEGLPLSVLEALALGKPCLITDAVGLGGLFQNYTIGLCVKTSQDSIAEGLKRISSLSDAELERMGKEARNVVFREFSWEKTAAALCAAYQRIFET